MPKKAARGKKLWRRTIDTQELQDALEEKSRQERQGLATDQLVDTQLFFIDKERDEATASAVEKGSLRPRRRREAKPLRCQTILEAAHKARPVNASKSQPRKRKAPAPKGKHLALQQSKGSTEAQQKASDALDIWSEEEADPRDLRNAKRRRGNDGGHIKAVEVDAPGCSYNPDLEQHEDVVAEAVAIEMAKAYQQDMQPKPIQFLQDPAEATDELDLLLVDAEPDEAEDGGGVDEVSKEEQEAVVRHVPEKKTQKDRNKDRRRREAEEAQQAKQRLKQQRRDLQSLKDLKAEISKQEAAKAAKAARKAVMTAEKLASEPVRLSKHKFQPASLQVLLSEEIDGSLRRLKGAPMLAKDRFKSLQKRGVIEPRVRLQPRQARKKPTYQIGDRVEKNKAGHEDIRLAQKTIARRKAAASKALGL